MKFYNVRERKSILVPDDQCKKVCYEHNGRKIYAVRCKVDGTSCIRFVTKEQYMSFKCK